MAEGIVLTEAAAFRVKEMMEQNDEQGSVLRVAINGGGCSGLTYGLGFEEQPAETDTLSEQHAITVVIDKEDLPLITGTVIDYKESLMGGGFTIDNPNAIASCGCGTSFKAATREGKPSEC